MSFHHFILDGGGDDKKCLGQLISPEWSLDNETSISKTPRIGIKHLQDFPEVTFPRLRRHIAQPYAWPMSLRSWNRLLIGSTSIGQSADSLRI